MKGLLKFTLGITAFFWTVSASGKVPEFLKAQIKETADSGLFDRPASVEQWLKQQNVPALGLGIIERGQLRQVRVYGELRKGEAAPFNTLFNVASLTKPVTAMVALKLVHLGKWDLDEPLFHYWTDPDVAGDPRHRKLTTRLVLSHQTGFPNWRWMLEGEKLAFQFEPGTKYQYSGEGMEYLRKALEKKLGKSLDRLAAELIFDPLHMEDTRFFPDSRLLAPDSRLATGYDPQGKSYPHVKNAGPNAADDLLTTIGDYGRFLVNVIEGAGLNPELFSEMQRPQVPTRNGKHFGLGFERYDLDGGDFALSHGGADKGVQAIFFIFPRTGDGLLIFTNVDDGYKVYESLLVHFLGKRGKQIFDIEMGGK